MQYVQQNGHKGVKEIKMFYKNKFQGSLWLKVKSHYGNEPAAFKTFGFVSLEIILNLFNAN